MKRGNIYNGAAGRTPEEQFEELAAGNGVRIERIVSDGHASSEGFWYDQDRNEWVLLLQGSAGLGIEGSEGEIVLWPGDWIDIPAHVRHRVAWTDKKQKTVWLAVFY